jgi:hypothetical protein
MFKFILKLLAGILSVILGLILAIYLVFWVVNLHDQPPSELATTFESNYINRIKISDQDNAFVYFMGFSVAQNEDPKVWGAKRIALVTHATDEEVGGLSNDPIMQDYLYKNSRIASVEKFSSLFKLPVDENIFATLEGNKGVVVEWVNTEGWLLTRYLELLNYKQYQEYVMTDPAAPLPNYAAVLEAQKLFFAKLWLQAEQGNVEVVKNLLEHDLAYWRVALASSDMLISKMIAVAALNRHFAYGNLILKKLSMKTQVNAIPESWKIAFTKTELSTLRVFNGEWIFQDRVFKKLKQKPDDYFYESFHLVKAHWLANLALPFFQSQDVSNRQATYFKKLIDGVDVSLDKYVEAIDELEDGYEEEQELRADKLNFHIYNAAGIYLIHLGEAEYGSSVYIPYSSRVTDLEGVRQAAVLTSELRNQSLSTDAIPDFITNSTYQNPYTLKPFEWDAETKAVKFTGLEEGERGTYLFAY